MKRYRWNLDLQLFADGLIDFDEDNTDGSETETETEEDTDDDGFDALDADDYKDVSDPIDEDTEPETETETEADPEAEVETEADPEPEPDKKKQSAEENARFAEERRQRQVADELAKLKESDPAFLLAKELSDMYGTSADEMLAKIREDALIKKSKETNVPVEFLKAQQASIDKQKELEDKLNALQVEGWMRRMDSEAVTLKTEFPILTDDDIEKAKVHMIGQLGRIDMPLEEVVMSLHGKRLIESLRTSAKQEALAEMSGRKGILPTGANKSGNSSDTGLTAEEKFVAKQMGMSEADYKKYKT